MRYEIHIKDDRSTGRLAWRFLAIAPSLPEARELAGRAQQNGRYQLFIMDQDRNMVHYEG